MKNRKLVQRKCVAETIFKNKKGFEVKIFSDFGYGNYEYINPLKKDVLEIKDFNEFLENIACWESSAGRGKKKRRYGVLKHTSEKRWGEETQVRIFEDEFISCKLETLAKEVNLKDTTIGRISKDLNAEEFLAFLKDNNIGYPFKEVLRMEDEKILRFKSYQNEDFEDEEKLICLNNKEVILHGDRYHDGITDLIEGFFYGLDYAKIEYIREEEEIVDEIEFISLGDAK